MAQDISMTAKTIMLDAIMKTHSSIAYVAAVHENQKDVIMLAWSSGAMSQCAVADKPIDYHVTKMGLWGDALRQKKVFVTNDYAADKSPSKHGYPKGHIEIKRHMNGPVIVNGSVVAIVGVGNSSAEYTEADKKSFSQFIDGLKDKLAEIRKLAFKK
jgi:two-component system, OmpR family, phosphate regulon sensor histidine kinase PhoR